MAKKIKSEKKTKTKQGKGKKLLRWIGKSALIGFISFISIIIILILLYWNTNLVASGVEKFINNKLSEVGTVEYGKISGSLINDVYIDSLYFELYDKVALNTKDVRLSYDLWSFLGDEIKISSIYID